MNRIIPEICYIEEPVLQMPVKIYLNVHHVTDLPGYKVFFDQFKALEAAPSRSLRIPKRDERQRQLNIRAQVKASQLFESFLAENNKSILLLFESDRVRQSLKEAEYIFTDTVIRGQKTLSSFRATSLELIETLNDATLKQEFHQLRAEILHEGASCVNFYQAQRETLFLTGLFSRFKNELENQGGKIKRMQFENITTPGALDMIKSVGGTIKKITDSLIPRFVEEFHKKVVLNLPKPGGDDDASRLHQELAEAYRSRSYSASQRRYFEQYRTLSSPRKEQ